MKETEKEITTKVSMLREYLCLDKYCSNYVRRRGLRYCDSIIASLEIDTDDTIVATTRITSPIQYLDTVTSLAQLLLYSDYDYRNIADTLSAIAALLNLFTSF